MLEKINKKKNPAKHAKIGTTKNTNTTQKQKKTEKKRKKTHIHVKETKTKKKDRKKSFSIQPVFSLFFMFHFFVKAIFFFKLIKAVFSML